MRFIRAAINALLVATLLKPMTRWTIARWRRRAREIAEETIVLPAREVIEAVVPAEIVLAQVDLPPAIEEIAEALQLIPATEDADAEDPIPVEDILDVDEALEVAAGRGVVRLLLVAGALAAIGVAAGYALVLLRRRRAAAVAKADVEPELVAIPIDVTEPDSETEERALEDAVVS